MAAITKKTCENNGIEVITDELGKLCLMKDMLKNNQDIKSYLHLQTNMMKNAKMQI